MIAAAVTFLMLLASLADSIACAITLRRIQRDREAWPPRRVIATRDNLEDTF